MPETAETNPKQGSTVQPHHSSSHLSSLFKLFKHQPSNPVLSTISGKREFNKPGRYVWIVPNGVGFIDVILIGGGAAGGVYTKAESGPSSSSSFGDIALAAGGSTADSSKNSTQGGKGGFGNLESGGDGSYYIGIANGGDCGRKSGTCRKYGGKGGCKNENGNIFWITPPSPYGGGGAGISYGGGAGGYSIVTKFPVIPGTKYEIIVGEGMKAPFNKKDQYGANGIVVVAWGTEEILN
ncbi:MAG: hypothetical protein Satyrvirus43_6 [Satyrvirus sp.]|uniref:Uncharacterized protein n=1 Tax=Satyrvirus sp. TaxID=2487771 RepID=A0A3G5AF42_9VIRU|nr:MAG: hypothetical protein Satyrvirus43_6 [Satyrvirus sp.]